MNDAEGRRKARGDGEPSVAAGMAKALFDFAVARGAPPAALAAEAGLDLARLADADDRAPLAVYLSLMRAGARLTKDPAFALHFGAGSNITQISVVGLIGAAAPTVREALGQINRYARLIAEFDTPPDRPRFEIEPAQNGEVWLVDNRSYANESPEVTESVFARMAQGMRQLGEGRFLRAAEVTHAPPVYHALYAEIFGAPVRFNAARNALRFDAAWLDVEIAREPRFMFGILTAHADAQLAALDAGRTLRARLETLMLPILHTGEATVEGLASSLGMSRQTLYRRLKAEGTSFEAVLDGLRRRLALDYLGARKVSVNETAYLVGFSDPAAFSRAFKRWTGASPKAWREQRR